MRLSNFFHFGPIATDQMMGTYDWRLILLSYLVAVVASYIAQQWEFSYKYEI